MVSLTAVGAFDAVGSILVVALMIGPPAAANLLTDHLPRLLGFSALIGVISAVSGYWLAHAMDASIAGSMATMVGVLFVVTFLLAPNRGLIAIARRRARQRWQFAQLAIHLFNHEGLPEAEDESRIEHLHERMRWEPDSATQVVTRAEHAGIILRRDGHLALTEEGRQVARQAIVK